MDIVVIRTKIRWWLWRRGFELWRLWRPFRLWLRRRRWRRMTRGVEAITSVMVQIGEEAELGQQAIQGFLDWWDSLPEATKEEMRRLDAIP